jgi:hypothetical protein
MESSMRPEMFQRVEASGASDGLPFRATQDAATAPNLMYLLLLSVLAAAVVLPQIALAGYALSSPEFRVAILAQPVVSLQLAIALVFWIGLFAWPLHALYGRLTWRRTVEITDETVAVADLLAFGGSNWTAPLASYRGIAHHIRSSLSGNRHELVLVHPDPKRSVLLMVAEHLSDTDVTRMTHLLRLPQVAANELYRFGVVREAAVNKMSWNALPA